jgi:hypothetical protein
MGGHRHHVWLARSSWVLLGEFDLVRDVHEGANDGGVERSAAGDDLRPRRNPNSTRGPAALE